MDQKPFIVGLSGVSGSGKTTFLNRLRACFDGDHICVISQDNYYKKKELQLKDQKGIHNFDRPESIHKDAFISDFQSLLNGKSIELEEYTFNNELATTKKILIKPAPIIFVEGLFVFHYEEIRSLLDLKLFLNIKESTAFGRRIKRDQIERNYPLEDILYRYENHVLPNYEKFIKPYLYEADLVLNNQNDFGIAVDVIATYLKNR